MKDISKCTYRVEFEAKEPKIVDCKSTDDAKKQWETDKHGSGVTRGFICNDKSCQILKK